VLVLGGGLRVDFAFQLDDPATDILDVFVVGGLDGTDTVLDLLFDRLGGVGQLLRDYRLDGPV